MQYETPEDALKAAVSALGGPKKVGVLLWPQLEDQPDKAGRKLADHLNDERAEKLSLEQVVFIFRKAKQVGFHDGMYAFNRMCGYSPSKPMDDAEELARKSAEAMALLEQLQRTQDEIRALVANAEQVAA
jgi:hypothetical protein